MISLIRPSYSTMEKDAIKNLSERYTAHTGKIKIDGSVSAKRNKPLKVELSLGGTKAVYEGAIVDMAKTRPTDRNEIEKQMRRLGDTCFDFSSLEVSADDDIFIPVSALNKARREAVRLLETRLLSEYRRLRTEVCNIHIPAGYDQLCDQGGPYINCRIDKGEMLDTVLCHDLVDTVTIDASMLDPENINYFDDRVHGRGVKLFLALPMIIRNKYFERNKYITDALRMGIFDGVIADNLESLYHLKQCGYSGIVVSDIHMYAANDISVSVLKSLGADVITYPVELNAKELSSLKLERGEFIIYGRMPMMVSAQCIKKTLDKCSHNSEMGEIRDRYGNIFPYVSNCSECYNVILNCVPNMILPNFELPKGLKPYSYRIHFTVEDKASINGVLDLYGDILVNKKERTLNIEHTLGHLKRGVE